MSEDLWLTFFTLEHSSEHTFAKTRNNLDYIDTESRKESQGFFPFCNGRCSLHIFKFRRSTAQLT